ncbi:histidine kinase [Cellulomonas fimi]|uniref:histidine kinase n=1 Tax=Cellulomonas fimi TaxID=1708 RepID=A0A7Y0LX20_CELFI|nr:histidine kinase [Cellulomonas fimi]NMR19827.1 two-component sensor histidine kinase [Cellulomonas fimi]
MPPGLTPGATPDPLFTELNTRRLGPVRRYFLTHPVAMDVFVAAWFGVPALATGVFRAGGPHPGLLVFAVAGTAVLMWRRRSPVRTAAVVGALGVLSVGLMDGLNGFDLAAAFTIYAVAASMRPRTAWWTLGALVLALGGAVALWGDTVPVPTRPDLVIGTGDDETTADMRIGSITTTALLSLAALAIGTSVRNRRIHVAALVERANQLAVERDQQAQLAAAAERTRIAREMHDVVAHSLSVMIALADGAAAALDRSPERARQAVGELSETGRSALADMRRVLGVLRDPEAPLGPQPGALDLAELVATFRSAGLAVRTTFTGFPLPPDAGLQLTVYRIVQESLTNVLRHAPGAGRVDVVVTYAHPRVDVVVTDDGGARAGGGSRHRDVSGGKGLVGMRERAAVYGGVVEAGPFDGGWRTHAVLTWDEEDG